MKNLHEFVWLMESYSRERGDVCNTWSSIQIIFNLDEPVLKLFNLPNTEDYSKYVITWVCSNKKLPRTAIPDEVLIDYFNLNSSLVTDENLTKRVKIDDSLYINGRYGLYFSEFSYYENESEERVYKVDQESAQQNNIYIKPWSYNRGGSGIKSCLELKGKDVNLSNQAKLFITCLIGRMLVWNGRGQKFKILQYTKEQIDKEREELFKEMQQWVTFLSDYYNVPDSSSDIKSMICYLMSEEDRDYSGDY